ncbi:hypothetical protein Pse7367_3400 [Thalassoporum mexicanum PCC 7367]|nr:hypothetical protein Pse7367_3400 [Pseudanabaena sp. PCC 7367]
MCYGISGDGIEVRFLAIEIAIFVKFVKFDGLEPLIERYYLGVSGFSVLQRTDTTNNQEAK